MEDVTSRYYLRFRVQDRPGVMSRLAGALGDAGVSIEQIVQEAQEDDAAQGEVAKGPVDVVLITHLAREGAVRGALAAIAGEPFSAAPARLVRIEGK
jgi:homoserine dehydrogenase